MKAMKMMKTATLESRLPQGEESPVVLLAQEKCSVSDVEQITYDLDIKV